MSRLLAALPALLVFAVAACDDLADPSRKAPVSVTLISSNDAASLHTKMLLVSLSSPAGVRVLYQATEPKPLIVELNDPRLFHSVPLTRLRADATYQVEVLPLAAGVRVEPQETSFTTDPLPDDLADLEFTTEGDLSAPLVLVEINNNEGGFEGVIAVDDEGAIVWHYRLDAVAGATRRQNGDFVISSGSVGLEQVSPVSGLVHSLAQRGRGNGQFHHEIIVTPWNTLFALADASETVDGTRVRGESIWEWVPEAGTITRRWSSFDHFSYAEHRGWGTYADDWMHANALWIGPSGNVLVSLAFLDQVISLTPDFAAVEWLLGGPNASIPLAGDLAFHMQHTAAEVPAASGRRVILFDNGPRDRGYSRALELAIDPAAGTAEKVWEFRPPNDNWSPIVSLARRLDNGNTFVSFGASTNIGPSHGPVEAYEVNPGGEIMWHMTLSGFREEVQFVNYRVTPIGSLAGEAMLDRRAVSGVRQRQSALLRLHQPPELARPGAQRGH
jgi:hypothetical protein